MHQSTDNPESGQSPAQPYNEAETREMVIDVLYHGYAQWMRDVKRVLGGVASRAQIGSYEEYREQFFMTVQNQQVRDESKQVEG